MINYVYNERGPPKKKLQQKDLAELVNVSPRHIAFIESGERAPSLELAFKLSCVLNKRVDELFAQYKCTKSTLK